MAKLKKNLIRARLVDIEGEARLLVTVQGKLNEGDSPIGVEQLVPKVDACGRFKGTSSHRRTVRLVEEKPTGQQRHLDSLPSGYPYFNWCLLIEELE